MKRMTQEQFQFLKVGQELYRAGLLSLSEAHKIHEIAPRVEAGEPLSDAEVALVAKLNNVLFAA